MYCGLWQPVQVSTIRSLLAGETGSFTWRIPWWPWHDTQVATRELPFWACFPCSLVRYWASWSVGNRGLSVLIPSMSEWQPPHSVATAQPEGRATNPVRGALAAAASFAEGSPRWQLAQARPAAAWTSGPWAATRSRWQSAQVSGAAAGAAPAMEAQTNAAAAISGARRSM